MFKGEHTAGNYFYYMNLKDFINLKDYYYLIGDKEKNYTKRYYYDCYNWRNKFTKNDLPIIGKFAEIDLSKIENYCWILDQLKESISPKKNIGIIDELAKPNYFPHEILFIGDDEEAFEARVKNDYIIEGQFGDTIFRMEIVAANIDLDKDGIEDWIIIYDYSTVGSTYSKCYPAIISRNLGKNGVHGRFSLKKKLPDTRCG